MSFWKKTEISDQLTHTRFYKTCVKTQYSFLTFCERAQCETKMAGLETLQIFF